MYDWDAEKKAVTKKETDYFYGALILISEERIKVWVIYFCFFFEGECSFVY